LDFVAKRYWFFAISLLVIVPGMVYLVATGLNPGLDFTGGSSLTLEFPVPVDQEELRLELNRNDQPDATVQRLGDNMYFLRTTELQEEAKDALVEALTTKFAPDSPDDIQLLSFDLVSPIVARETVVAAIWAVLAAAVGIFFYVWWAFRNVPSPFRYGTAAIIALLHDTAVVIGIFAILGEVNDVEVNTMFLVALLTVIGYSVNDTIVIFDRLRENVLLYPNCSFASIANLSISESLGRSLNTSLTLLFTLLAMMLFGGPTIRSFLLVLLIGVVVGTYSSIGIASQLVVSWEAGDFGRIFRRVSPFGAR
jgi:preprotein translocase subunit SecF